MVNGVTANSPEFEVMLDNRIDKDRFFNSSTLTQVNPTDREISVRLSVPYGDYATLRRGLSGGVSVVATFTNGTVSMQFNLPKVVIVDRDVEIQSRDAELMRMLEGTAYRSNSGADPSMSIFLDSTV